MQFSSWKEWVKKYLKNDNKNEKPEEKEQDPSTPLASSTTELLQPSQEIARENVIYNNNDGTIRLFPTNKFGSYFILGKQNPNNLKNFTTDSHNEFVKKKEKKY